MKYPEEIFKVVRRSKDGTTKTFSVDEKFAWNMSSDSPLIPESYSRIALSVFTAKSGKRLQYAQANIQEAELCQLIEKSKACVAMAMADSPSSPAGQSHQVELNGKYKGKTPAELLASGTPRADLENQKKWLESNLQRYPGNRKMIEAIDEALSAQAGGSLSQIASSSIKVFTTGTRFKGRAGQERPNLMYVLDVGFSRATGNFSVSFVNWLAPVTKLPDGRVQFQQRPDGEVTRVGVTLSAEEWLQFIGNLERIHDAFVSVTFAGVWNAVQKSVEENRRAYQQQSPSQQQYRQSSPSGGQAFAPQQNGYGGQQPVPPADDFGIMEDDITF